MIAQRTPHALDGVHGDVTGFETVTIPPGNDRVRVCAGWPECGCEGDCDGLQGIVLGPTPAERRTLFILLIVVAAAGCALIWLGLR